MSEVILVRHGQASLGSDNYDQLSLLGHKQALWLGEHLQSIGTEIDRVVLGSLTRHRETAEGILAGFGKLFPLEIEKGFNELSSQNLFNAMQAQFPELISSTGELRKDYHNNMGAALSLWMSGRIESQGTASWQHFTNTIQSAFKRVCEGSAKRTLVVTSGGPISVVMGQVLQLENNKIKELMLRIKNSSTTQFLYRRGDEKVSLDSFNDVSHLNNLERKEFITFA